jgi:hypothetical protein
MEIIGGRHHGEHDIAVRQVLFAFHDDGAVLGQRRSLGRGAVPDTDTMARLEQSLDHGLAHATQTDPSDAIAHSCFLFRVACQSTQCAADPPPIQETSRKSVFPSAQ